MEIEQPAKITQKTNTRLEFILYENKEPADLEDAVIIFKWQHQNKTDNESDITCINNHSTKAGSVYVDWNTTTSDVTYGWYDCQFIVNKSNGDVLKFPKSKNNEINDFYKLIVARSL